MTSGYDIAAGIARDFAGFWKFGFNADIGTTEETVWDEGGAYSYLAAAAQLTVSSSNANDASGGTGARTVQLYGLDGSYDEIEETATLNGQTAVTTTNSFLRIFRIIVRTAGSGDANAGDIYAGTGTVTAGVPANIFAKVLVGKNQTLMCLWTVPLGKRAFLAGLFVTSQGNAAATAEIRLIARPQGEVFQTKDDFVISQAGGPAVLYHAVPVFFEPKTDIEVRAVASTGTMDVSAGLQFMTQG